MSENTENTTGAGSEQSCSTETTSDQSYSAGAGSEQSSYTKVKTSYARACIVLLAVNFVLTGYCFLQISKYQGEQIEGLEAQASENSTATAAKPTKSSAEGENKPTTP